MYPVVVIDAQEKEYKLYDGKNVQNHFFSNELLDKEDVELFRYSPTSFMYEPDNSDSVA